MKIYSVNILTSLLIFLKYFNNESGATTSPYLLIGCYVDSSNRAMSSFGVGGYTVGTCGAYAKSNGFAYFGLQWYGEGSGATTGHCFLSNSLADSTQYGSSTGCVIGADGYFKFQNYYI